MYIVISVYTQINKCNFGLSTNIWGVHTVNYGGSDSEALHNDLLTHFCLILRCIRHIYAPNCRKDMNG